jgi:hypothetical protein
MHGYSLCYGGGAKASPGEAATVIRRRQPGAGARNKPYTGEGDKEAGVMAGAVITMTPFCQPPLAAAIRWVD